MWQDIHTKLKDKGFTVVGIALDSEGIGPAKIYYDKYKVTFPALVDPNYATKFGAVPHTFFVDQHGVVRKKFRITPRHVGAIAKLLKPKDKLLPVTDKIRSQWSKPGQRLHPSAIAALVKLSKTNPKDLKVANQLASRYLDLKQFKEAKAILARAIKNYEPKDVARGKKKSLQQNLAQAYFQLSRAAVGDRKAQVKYATMSYYLSPTIGYAKQISRIIAPEKFDTKSGRFDNRFREATAARLRRERAAWLKKEK